MSTKLVRFAPRPAARSAFEQMFNDLARFNSDTVRPVMRPALDVIETETGLEIRMDLPGLASSDLNVTVEDHVLTISGERSDTVDSETERYTYRERRHGAFSRSVRLGESVDVDNIEAAFENGVLTLSLPKLPEAQPKQIAVKTV